MRGPLFNPLHLSEITFKINKFLILKISWVFKDFSLSITIFSEVACKNTKFGFGVLKSTQVTAQNHLNNKAPARTDYSKPKPHK
jgi:hypothetical protein